MVRAERNFCSKYGPWAVVVGASEGLGEAFARQLAARGLNVLLLARRASLLAEVEKRIREEQGVEVRSLAIDVAHPTFCAKLVDATRDLDIGMLVYNAAFVPIGPFVERSEEELRQLVDVNVAGPLLLLHKLLPRMCERRRGGVVLMSSLSGMQGSPRIAAYAASKAFNTILAEGLWGELAEHGIDVLASCAGAISTPNYAETSEKTAPGTLAPQAVARKTLDALGRGPRVVPGWVNRIASVFMGRLLPRKAAVRLMAANTKDLS
jgi:hypothetical protein